MRVYFEVGKLTVEQTFLAGIIAYLLLPTSISSAPYLSEEEKEFALLRLQGRTQATITERFKYVKSTL
jgi:uncharacterized protein YecE (DUF72 family)